MANLELKHIEPILNHLLREFPRNLDGVWDWRLGNGISIRFVPDSPHARFSEAYIVLVDSGDYVAKYSHFRETIEILRPEKLKFCLYFLGLFSECASAIIEESHKRVNELP